MLTAAELYQRLGDGCCYAPALFQRVRQSLTRHEVLRGSTRTTLPAYFLFIIVSIAICSGLISICTQHLPMDGVTFYFLSYSFQSKIGHNTKNKSPIVNVSAPYLSLCCVFQPTSSCHLLMVQESTCSAIKNSRTANQIFMEFGMVVTLLEHGLNYYFSIPCNR
jgi:hypothetical protein